MRRALTAIFWLIFSQFAESMPVFRHYTPLDGLAGYSVRGIMQDRQGYIWLTTMAGISRFDGYRFKNFHYDPSNRNSLSISRGNLIFQDSKGTLWHGASAGDLNSIQADHSVKRHPLSNPFLFVWDIIESPQGLWLATEDGLIHYDPVLNEEEKLVANVFITSLYQFSENELWLGSYAGLLIYDIKSGKARSTIMKDRVWSIKPSGQGDFWIGTISGLYLYNKHLQTFTQQIPNIKVRDIEVHQDKVYLATDNDGLVEYLPQNGQIQRFLHDPDNKDSISSNIVWSLTTDRTGVLWIGTNAGLNQLNPSRQAFEIIRFKPDTNTLLNHRDISAILEDNNANLWISTRGSGLTRFNPRSQKITRYRHQPGNPNSLSEDIISKMLLTRDGSLWLGTYKGLSQFHPDSGTFTQYPADPNQPDALSNGSINCLTEDSQGRVIAGTDDGLNFFDYRSKSFTVMRPEPNNANSLAHKEISACYVSQDKSIWVGSLYGLNRFDPDTKTFKHYYHDDTDPSSLTGNLVTSIFESEPNILWIGTLSGGLSRLSFDDKGNPHFKNFTTANGLLDNSVSNIIPGNDHKLWFSGKKGLSSIDTQTDLIINYDHNDGVLFSQFRSGRVGKQGKLYFTAIGGYISFWPSEIRYNEHLPHPAITDFKIFEHPIPMTDSIILKHTENMLTLEFSAMDFTATRKNRYRYLLEGFHTDWISPDFPKAVFTNIDSGNYLFRVQATNGDGLWSTADATIAFTVLPAPWLTWWAFTLYGLTIISLLAFYARIQHNKRSQQAEFNQQIRALSGHLLQIREDERSRVAREIHDDLGQNLIAIKMSISMVAKNLKQEAHTAALKKMSGMITLADDTVISLRRICADLRPSLLDDLGLGPAIELYAEEFSERYSILSEVDLDYDELRLTSDIETAIFRIFQESLINVHRHAQAQWVKVRLTIDSGEVLLYIQDNGIGVTQGAMSKQNHYGLLGMRERARLFNGELTISTPSGQGTLVELRLPQQQALL